MNALPLDAAESVARLILDTRDIAALRSTSRFWASVYTEESLWKALIEARFGAQHVPEDPHLAMSTFQELAKLRVPAASGSVIWLDGQHLEEDEASGSLSKQVIRLKFVCWLHLSASIPGALPGRYEARCRMRFLPGWHTDELNIAANPQEGCGEPAARRYTWQQLANSVGPGWVEVSTGPLVVTQPCSVEVTVHGHTGNWKRGILFDTMRLVPVGRPRPEWASPSRGQQQVLSQHEERAMQLRSGRSVGWEGCSVQ